MTAGVALTDVNVLIALLWPRHMHHDAAQAWLTENRSRGWATCPITELGTTRILSSAAVTGGLLAVGDVLRQLEQIMADEQHHFWADDVSTASAFLHDAPIHGPAQLTDRYLLALAAARGGTLATFDRALAASLPSGSTLHEHLELIPS